MGEEEETDGDTRQFTKMISGIQTTTFTGIVIVVTVRKIRRYSADLGREHDSHDDT